MATQTTHFDMAKQQSAEHVSVGLLNDNFDIIDQVMYDNQEKSEQLADEYNAGTTYNVGDYVRRENYIYKCNTASTTGVWDSTKWDKVKITDELGGGGGSSTLAGLNDVDLSSPTDGQVLGYNATTGKWENVTGGGGGGSTTFAGLNDVNVTGVQNGDIARYNSTTGKWTDSSDLTDLELSVSQLSSSVLNIAGDVDALELTVSQMSASTLPYDANTSTKQKIDNVESSIPTSASDLPYSSGVSTKQKIDEVASSGNMQIISFPAISTVVEFNSTRTTILSKSGVSLKKGKYAFITSINATWTFGSYQAYLGIKVGNLYSIGFSAANPQSNLPCQVLSEINIPADGTYTIELFGQTAHVSKGVTIPAYQEPNCLMIKL